MKNEFVAVYITAPNQKDAQKLAQLLLKERLVGCVNIVPYIESLYRWGEKIENHSEALLIVKTRSVLMKDLVKFVKKHHSYKVPCINALPILEGNPDYLKWLKEETKKS